jgi:Escherichia/Staphylococcus phage prohead protease
MRGGPVRPDRGDREAVRRPLGDPAGPTEGGVTVEGVIYRIYEPDLEVRAGGDGRTVVGIAVPWAVPQRIDSGLVEQFRRGAFNHQLRSPHRVRFAREHVQLGGTLIGVTRMLRDDATGLYGEWYVSRTPAGDETLELLKDGALRELSIGFKEGQNRRLSGGVTERVTATLGEVAAVMQGAYGELAMATGVRSAGCPHCATVGDGGRLAEAQQIIAGLPVLPA